MPCSSMPLSTHSLRFFYLNGKLSVTDSLISAMSLATWFLSLIRALSFYSENSLILSFLFLSLNVCSLYSNRLRVCSGITITSSGSGLSKQAGSFLTKLYGSGMYESLTFWFPPSWLPRSLRMSTESCEYFSTKHSGEWICCLTGTACYYFCSSTGSRISACYPLPGSFLSSSTTY